MRNWIGETSDTPIFRGGLSSEMSYLIIATKKESSVYNCICVRKKNGGFNTKFYPSIAFWGLSKEDVVRPEFEPNSFVARPEHGYERFFATKGGIDKLLSTLSKDDSNVVAPLSFDNFDENHLTEQVVNISLELHPVKGPKTPDVPFVRGG